MSEFAEYDLKRAQDIIEARADAQAAIALLFFNGDHWQGGNGWIGPRAEGVDGASVMALIERAFISYNAIREVVSRHSTAVVGKPLHWKLTIDRDLETTEIVDPVTGAVTIEEGQPTSEEESLIAEAEAALVGWLDQVKALKVLRQVVIGSLLGKRAILRVFVPPGLLDEGGNVPAGDLRESLDRIAVQCLNLNEDSLDQQAAPAAVFMDKTSRQEIGVFIYQDEDENDRAELVYVDENGDTVLRIIDEGGNVIEPIIMPLGRRLTLYEMTRDTLVTRQMISQQKALNLSTTNRSHNDVMAAFLERLLFNVQLPGKFVDDPNVSGGKRFVPDPFHVGAGTTNVLQGMIIEDEDGARRIANPSVTYRDPVSPDTFIRSSDASYLNILREANQLHYVTVSDATTSGESRKQARESYIADLSVTADELETAFRWLLETALAMATVFAGQPGRFEGLRAYAEAKISGGPVGHEDLRAAAEMWDRGVWSRERAMSQTGVDDVDAELARIEKEQGQTPGSTPGPSEVAPEASPLAPASQDVDDIADFLANGVGAI